MQPRARERIDLVSARGLAPGEYVLATAHRAGNVDDPERLALLVELLRAMPLPVVLALHPRTRKPAGERPACSTELERAEHVVLTPPLGYVELTALLCNARAVLTDSGGLQKEAYLAGVPCITLRREHRVDRDRRAAAGTCSSTSMPAAALEALEREPPARAPAAVRRRPRRRTRRVGSYTARSMRR